MTTDAPLDDTEVRPAGSLSALLEHDHIGIDAGIEGFIDAAGGTDRPALARALARLRRHIYLEEELLFPPLRDAGLVGPILVMLREHAQMWQILDRLDGQLADNDHDDARDAALVESCRELFGVLQAHNPKEERILYPQADTVLDRSDNTRVRRFLDAGDLPDGWVCHHLQGSAGGTGRREATPQAPGRH